MSEWLWRHPHVRWAMLRFSLYVVAWNVLVTLNYLAFHGHLD